MVLGQGAKLIHRVRCDRDSGKMSYDLAFDSSYVGFKYGESVAALR